MPQKAKLSHTTGCCAGILFLSILFCQHTYPRLQLAALHFNENSNREQATTQEGEQRYCIRFPKFKRGGHTVRKILTDPTYSKHTLNDSM